MKMDNEIIWKRGKQVHKAEFILEKPLFPGMERGGR